MRGSYMLFKKYHIVIFKDKQGTCRKVGLHGGIVLLLLLLFAGMTAGNVFLWQRYISSVKVEKDLSLAEKTIHEQKTQLLSLAQKLGALQKSLGRIHDFDSKLRVMIDLDQDSSQNAGAKGGVQSETFSNGYLPLYRQELLARKMHNFLKQLNVEARLEEVKQQDILARLRQKNDILEATPSIWPVKGWITSPFGWRTSPFTGKREYHPGLDISAPIGTPIYAPAKGKIILSGNYHDGYGNQVKLYHGGNLVTRYGHMSNIAVKKGQSVTRGELIGYVGSTGRSTGPHLHYEVRKAEVAVNPMKYILN